MTIYSILEDDVHKPHWFYSYIPIKCSLCPGSTDFFICKWFGFLSFENISESRKLDSSYSSKCSFGNFGSTKKKRFYACHQCMGGSTLINTNITYS